VNDKQRERLREETRTYFLLLRLKDKHTLSTK